MKKFDFVLLILGVGIVLALSSVIVFKQFRYSYKDSVAAMQSSHVSADTETDSMKTESMDTNTDMKDADTNTHVEMDGNAAENMNESKSAGVSETKPQSTKKNLELNAVPDEGAGEKKTTSKSKKVCLAFAGDIYLSDFVLQAYQKEGNQISGVLDDGFREKIAEADLFVANEEFPFSDRGTAAKDKQFTFRLPTEKVSMFQELGLDLVTLANNHALDFGKDALLDTCETLDKAAEESGQGYCW